MTKLTDILNEIKINNPTDIFKVTDEGIQAVKDYHTLVKLIEKYTDTDPIENMLGMGVNENETNKDMLDLLNWSVIIDESIIDLNKPNKYSDVFEKNDRILGHDEDSIKSMMASFKEQGWIK